MVFFSFCFYYIHKNCQFFHLTFLGIWKMFLGSRGSYFLSSCLFCSFWKKKKKPLLLLRPCFPRGSFPGLVSVSRAPHHSHRLLCVGPGGSITRGHSYPHHWGMSAVFLFVVILLRCSTSVLSFCSPVRAFKSAWKPASSSIFQRQEGSHSHKQVQNPQLSYPS